MKISCPGPYNPPPHAEVSGDWGGVVPLWLAEKGRLQQNDQNNDGLFLEQKDFTQRTWEAGNDSKKKVEQSCLRGIWEVNEIKWN